jgi:hypothetical protein
MKVFLFTLQFCLTSKKHGIVSDKLRVSCYGLTTALSILVSWLHILWPTTLEDRYNNGVVAVSLL